MLCGSSHLAGRRCLLALLCTFAAARVATAAPPSLIRQTLLRLTLPAAARAEVHTLHDNGTVSVSFAGYGDAARIGAALGRQDPNNFAMVARQTAFEPSADYAVGLPPPSGLRLYLTLPSRLVAVQGVRKGKSFSLEAKVQTPAAALKERLMHYYVPQLGAAQETANSLHSAEALLLAGRLGDATDAFNDLLRIYPLRPWAALRLADVTLLRRGTQEACVAYARVHSTYAGRAAGLVAGMHAAVLDCPDAPTSDRQEWESLLLRSQADDASSRWLAAEAHWSLTFAHDTSLLSQALAYGPRILGKKTYDNLFLKVMRLLPPLDRANFALANKAALLVHPDALDLKILDVQALCSLDLVQKASLQADQYAGSGKADPFLLGAGQCNVERAPRDVHLAVKDRREIFAQLESFKDRLAAVARAAAKPPEDT